MSTGQSPVTIDTVFAMPPERRADTLVRLGREVANSELNGGEQNGLAATDRHKLVGALAALLEEGVGDQRFRVEMGEVLGLLGDPRLTPPTDPDYWVRVELPQIDATVSIARFPVTNAEFRRFVNAGGYEDRALWSDEGWEWLKSVEDPWPVRAAAASSGPFLVPNQPVVGVTWYEAAAYAAAADARLPRFDERLWVARGQEKRPYPWGSPFGDGNANTREEVVGRPCAVGLFVRDRTPEGVRDLAGNVAEWNADGVGSQRWIHPGAWDQPSMAAWAKARFLEEPDSRWAGLGFRLARD